MLLSFANPNLFEHEEVITATPFEEYKYEYNDDHSYWEFQNHFENTYNEELISDVYSQSTQVDAISLLIPEILAGFFFRLVTKIEIFAYLLPEELVRVRRVCKKWKDISSMESLCKHVAFCRDAAIPQELSPVQFFKIITYPSIPHGTMQLFPKEELD